MVIQEDDKIIIRGEYKIWYDWHIHRFDYREYDHIFRLNQDEDLDQTYGTDGFVRDFPFKEYAFEPLQLALQSDGKLLMLSTDTWKQGW